MLLRRGMLLVWCAVLAAAEDAPQGLVSKDSHQDLIAEATQTGSQAQKREAGLLNSYGDPLPPDAYGPPQEVTLVSHFAELPPQPPVYGPPQGPPAGAYGPPAPVVFPSQSYEGPPPPRPSYPQRHYGPPKNSYPKHSYGPPKFSYKKNYGIKQSLPKPTYGLPFKTQKLMGPKPIYGPPKQIYSPPKPIYGPPKFTYGPPLTAPVHNVNVPDVSTVTVTSNIGSVSNNIDLGLNLPAPIYGTPLISLPQDLKPNFPIPADTYGPPGQVLGPIGPPVDQVVVHDTNIGYGPPQPDPNPQPPHPGIPAPPTPPHVIYDGWKPIPGATNPIGLVENVDDQYGPPPPPSDLILDQGLPSVDNHQFFSIDSQSAPIESQNHQFSTQITTGYSSVHQDALANVDLNAIIGGDTNNIDQAKTVFEAHYTDNSPQLDFAIQGGQRPQISVSQDSYLSPPVDSNSGGPYSSSLRAQGAKLLPPSGVYGVPPGSQYGAPPKALPPHLPIPYGSISGGPHSTQGWPKQPIKFRDPVPNGLLEHVGQTTHGKDTHGFDHGSHGPAYIPPPIRDVKDNNIHTGNLGLNSVSLSIEPTNLFSLPHAGSPLNFQVQQPSSVSYQTPASYPSNSYGPPLAIQQPSTSYGSPIDSYSVPLLTVGDHTASGSSDNAVTTTIDGTLLANLSNLDAAAILKHCPYHEAILKAARSGEKIPSDLAAKYVESLNSLGSSLGKNIFSDNQIVSEQNVFNIPVSSGESITFNTKDYSSGQTVVQAIHPEYKGEKYEKNKSKSLRDIGKQIKDEKIQYVTDEIYKTSEKIKSLSEETKRLQQKINSNNHNFNHIQQSNNEIPVKGKLGTYSLQFQSSNGKGSPSIPHEQLLSEGLLQSILQAIEQPAANGQIVQTHHTQAQNVVTSAQSIQPNYFQQPPSLNLGSFNNEGLVLPAGYEPIDRTKDKKDQDTQSSTVDIKKMLNNEIINNQRGDIPDCELKGEHSIRHSVVAPPNYEIKPVEELEDNDVAVYFDRKSDENVEPVTEISVATSISDNLDSYNTNSKKYGEKIKKT